MAQRGKNSMPFEQAERVRGVMRELLDSRFNGNRTRLAEAIGIKQPAVTQILGEKSAPSYQTAQRVAVLAGLDRNFWEGRDGQLIPSPSAQSMDTAQRFYGGGSVPSDWQNAVATLLMKRHAATGLDVAASLKLAAAIEALCSPEGLPDPEAGAAMADSMVRAALKGKQVSARKKK